MRKKIITAGIFLFVALTYTFIKNPTITSGTELTIETIEALAKEEKCEGTHPNGCHDGGPNQSSCEIDASYYNCLGGLGGGCKTSCVEGAYACCGLNCKCIENS